MCEGNQNVYVVTGISMSKGWMRSLNSPDLECVSVVCFSLYGVFGHSN
jgi:hypothetical protein